MKNMCDHEQSMEDLTLVVLEMLFKNITYACASKMKNRIIKHLIYDGQC